MQANDVTGTTIAHDQTKSSISPSRLAEGRPPTVPRLSMAASVDTTAFTPKKQRLTALYENQSANGGDAATKSQRSSRRSTKKSEMDSTLRHRQRQRQ